MTTSSSQYLKTPYIQDLVGNLGQPEIDRFLSAGDYDVLHSAWPGGHALDRIKRGSDDLEQALLAELRRREARVTVPRNTRSGMAILWPLAVKS